MPHPGFTSSRGLPGCISCSRGCSLRWLPHSPSGGYHGGWYCRRALLDTFVHCLLLKKYNLETENRMTFKIVGARLLCFELVATAVGPCGRQSAPVPPPAPPPDPRAAAQAAWTQYAARFIEDYFK